MEKVVRITTHGTQPPDAAYWLSRPVEERFAALEALRRQVMDKLPHAQQRLQRVCRVAQRKRG